MSHFRRSPTPTAASARRAVALLHGSVGQILHALRASGQEERTLVVFLSDNGAPPKNGSRNTPLRGTKGTTWEGGIRVPFVMQWKGVLSAGRVVDTPVISLDLLPTALAAAGIAAPRDATFDGVNLLPFLTGKASEPPHAALFWRYGEQMAVRQGDWKLARALDTTSTPPALKTALFNLKDDAGEQLDLSGAQSAKLKELQARWDTWNTGKRKGDTADEIAALLASSSELKFLQTLECVQTGPLRFAVKDSLEFAARIRLARPDTEAEERRQKVAAPAPAVIVGFEIPYALVGQTEVAPASARALGRDLASALAAYLRESHQQ